MRSVSACWWAIHQEGGEWEQEGHMGAQSAWMSIGDKYGCLMWWKQCSHDGATESAAPWATMLLGWAGPGTGTCGGPGTNPGCFSALNTHRQSCDFKRLLYLYYVRLRRLSGARGQDTGWHMTTVCGLSTKKHYAPCEHTRANQGWLRFTHSSFWPKDCFRTSLLIKTRANKWSVSVCKLSEPAINC